MARENLKIQIADDDGTLHDYDFSPHPALLSVGVVNKLQTILLAPLTAIIAGSRQTKEGGNLLDRELDAGAASQAATALAKAVTEAGEATFVKTLLNYAHTKRAGETGWTKCSDNIDMLYTQNMGELAMAVYHAVQCSFGKSLRRFFKGQPIFREMLSAASGLVDNIQQKTEQQQNNSATSSTPQV